MQCRVTSLEIKLSKVYKILIGANFEVLRRLGNAPVSKGLFMSFEIGIDI